MEGKSGLHDCVRAAKLGMLGAAHEPLASKAFARTTSPLVVHSHLQLIRHHSSSTPEKALEVLRKHVCALFRPFRPQAAMAVEVGAAARQLVCQRCGLPTAGSEVWNPLPSSQLLQDAMGVPLARVGSWSD